MDFGAGGYIAWVRGTSILVSKPKNSSQVTIAIIDSTNNGNTPATAAAFIKNTNPWANPTPIYVDAGSKIIESSGATDKPTEEVGITKASLLADTTIGNWARKNTIEDLDYLAEKLEANTTLASTKQRVEEEITSATPTDTDELRALLSSTTTGTSGNSNATEVGEEENEDKNDTGGEYGKKNDSQKKIIQTKRIKCKTEWKRYWVTTDNCEEKNLVAFLRNSDKVLVFKNRTLAKRNNQFNLSGLIRDTYNISITTTDTTWSSKLQVSNDEDLLWEITSPTGTLNGQTWKILTIADFTKTTSLRITQ